jgi:hypothetical protein
MNKKVYKIKRAIIYICSVCFSLILKNDILSSTFPLFLYYINSAHFYYKHNFVFRRMAGSICRINKSLRVSHMHILCAPLYIPVFIKKNNNLLDNIH